MYFESNNSRHLYGEAIDIINGTGISFDDLLKKHLLINGDILKIMYDNGLSCYIETSVEIQVLLQDIIILAQTL